METIVKADIFFFITSVIVGVSGVLFIAILVYLLRVVRSVFEIVERAKRELSSLVDDFHDVRNEVRGGVRATRRHTKALFKHLSLGRILAFILETVSEARAGMSKRRARDRTAASSDESLEER